MRYAAIIVYGCATLGLFVLGAVMGFLGIASVAYLLTTSQTTSYAIGVVAAILFGVLFAYPFFVGFLTALRTCWRSEM